jgi:hypothetical protein
MPPFQWKEEERAEFQRFMASGKGTNAEDAFNILMTIPSAVDRVRLIMYLTQRDPTLCETQLFADFANAHAFLDW